MAVETIPPPPRRGSFFRVWLPLILVALYAAALVAIWNWPDPDWPRVYRVVTTGFATILALLLLSLWFVAFSGVRWWLRLGVMAAGIAALVFLPGALIRDMHFSGDMVPVVHFRWERPPAFTPASDGTSAKALALADLAGDRPTDYPGYRGRQRDGVVEGPELTTPRPVWRHPCGGGYAGFAVAGNALVTIEQRGDREAVVCYDTGTGQERWAHDYPARFSERMGGVGPRATPTIADGDVYALGAEGELVCLEAATGKLKWRVNILEGNKNITWAMSGSPLVWGRYVVVNPGKQEPSAKYGALAAFDRKTGDLVWNSGSTRAGYSSPMLATLAGKRQILLFDAEGMGGYDAADGTELWQYPWRTNPQEIKVAQPIVLPGDRVFIATSYENGCAMLKVGPEENGKLAATPLWKNMKMRCRFTSPVADDQYLYGLDEGVLVCLDQETGKPKWRGERYGHGQLLRTGKQLLVLAEDGDLALVQATGDGNHELGRFPALEGHTWNYPSLAGGRAYVRNDREMACYDLTPPGAQAGNEGNRSPGR